MNLRIPSSLVLVLVGAAGGCVTADSDLAEGSQALTPASAFVLTVGGIEGEEVASPGRVDICPSGRCSFAYLAGTQLTITPLGSNAVADCLQFASWAGACAGQGATCNLVINGDLLVTSKWSRIQGCTPQ